jgi:uncharacterized repeat protein (TIGR03803 family)
MKHFAAVLAFCAFSLSFAFSQSEGILHTFDDGADGGNPVSGLIADSSGNFYGTTFYSSSTYGVVFQLAPPVDGGTWIENVLYSFTGGQDGANPESNLVLDAAGNLYGTTVEGGANGCGTFFQLVPGSPWTENSLVQFECGPLRNGSYLSNPGNIVMTSAGLFYGAVEIGGAFGGGWIYELAPAGSSWTYSVIHSFANNTKAPGYVDGCSPRTLILGPDNALFGTNYYCGESTGAGPGNSGTVFRLAPKGSNWNFTLLHAFGPNDDGATDGAGPQGLAIGKTGLVYGGTAYGGVPDNGIPASGTIYSLAPPFEQGQPWTHMILYSFTGGQNGDGSYPLSGVVVGNQGVLYGATAGGGSTGTASCNGFPGCGTIFELSETEGLWSETVLHSFLENGVDGNNPTAGMLLLRAGDLYGMTGQGGADNDGVAYAFHP